MKNPPRFVFIIIIIVFLVEPVAAQRTVPSVSAPAPIPSRHRSFSIPFEVRPDNSADPPKDVELMVSKDRGVRWHSVDRQPIEAKKFDFKAEEDGELWFTFRTVTLSGAIRQVGGGVPQLRVLVDSVAPTLELDMKQQPSGEILVQWKAKDANIRGKRPDFAVTGAVADLSEAKEERKWTPLNVDGRHFRADETGADGQFLFWPENDVTEIELRATLADSVGNKTEKTSSAKIKAVKLDEAARIRQALKSDEEKPMSPDGRVENPATPTAAPATPTTYPSGRAETAAVRVEPPRPVRMKKEAPVKPVSSDPKTEVQTEPQPAGVDPLTESLIAGMGRFFDGGLSIKVAPKTEVSAVQESSAGLPKLPSIVPTPAPTPAPAVKPTASSPSEIVKPAPVAASASTPPPQPAPQPTQPPAAPYPGKITGVSLNASTPQPQVIVKWHVGDAPWHGGQIDVLRSGDLQGPWLPMATNLPNTGEYWWYISNEDYKPFYIMVQIRSMQGGVHLDATKSAVRIPAKTAGR